MMEGSVNSYLMMEDSQEKINYISKPIKGAGFFRKYNCFHTLSISTHNLNGKIILEGTFNHNPSDKDWFKVYEKTYKSLDNISKETNYNDIYNFESNAVLFRVKLDRSYLNIDTSVSPENYTRKIGNIKKIHLSY